ncbi:hypothetical protein ACIHFD_49095 [Nonomuraea sp. NPDC051941]|uniref:hypothetical protein n=1 Tax=Nonomuraea sp. NPDC051941 TaxID=3364373 RepID=UPI0037C71FFD
MSDTAGNEHVHQPQLIGHILDQLEVQGCIHQGDFIVDAVVIAKINTEDGQTQVGIFRSKTLQPYDEFAMIGTAARHLNCGGHA